jgi:acyl-CoA thioester hydrolase
MTEKKSVTADVSEAIAGELQAGGHRLLARVYYADTDFSGVVYHGRYLEFFERGRTDFLRLKGVHHTELVAGSLGEELVWVVRRMEIDFKAPAKIDDLLVIETKVAEVSGARIYMQQMISCEGKLLCSALVEAVMITKQGKPRRFPAEWREAFLASE